MRTLPFIIGLAVGFWLVELCLGSVRPATATTPSTPKGAAENPFGSAPLVIEPTAVVEPAPPLPAYTRPDAYFSTFVFQVPSLSTISEEERADPEFAELYRRAVLGRARNQIAPLVPALGLSPPQYSALLGAVIDQAQRYHQRSRERMAERERAAFRTELSQATEARLAAVLTPEQMQRLAGLQPRASAVSFMAESFAQRGAPFSHEQIRHLLELKAAELNGEFYHQNPSTEADPEAAWMNDAQRRYEAERKRWQAAAALTDAMHWVRVKDPELRDMWPE